MIFLENFSWFLLTLREFLCIILKCMVKKGVKAPFLPSTNLALGGREIHVRGKS